MTFASYDALLTARAAGKMFSSPFSKAMGHAVAAQRCYTLFTADGLPVKGSNTTGTALYAYTCDDTTAGAIPHGGNVSSLAKFLVRAGVALGRTIYDACPAPAFLMLYDRLMYYPGIDCNSNKSQLLAAGAGQPSPPTIPRYTTGDGVRAFMEVTTALGATPANFTYGDPGDLVYGYTNSASPPVNKRMHATTVTFRQTATADIIAGSEEGGAGANWCPFLPLKAGDTGMTSVEAVKLSAAMGAGSKATLVLGRPLMLLPFYESSSYSPAVYSEKDCIQAASLPNVLDGACLALMACNYTGTTDADGTQRYFGELEFVWG